MPNKMICVGLVFFLIFFLVGPTGHTLAIELGGSEKMTNKQKHIVLLGASIGKGWNLEEFPQRITEDQYKFEYIGHYDFDKSGPLDKVLHRDDTTKPDAVIIKECAAYFPGDLDRYKQLVESWVEQCRQQRVVPVLATVVPVTQFNDIKLRVKFFLKNLAKFKFSIQGRQGTLLSYNEWIREYAAEQGIVVLDLEAALRQSATTKYLRNDVHNGDGLHLNQKGYELIDKIVIPALNKVAWH